MTMHLMSHAYTTTNTRKRKPKMTRANIAKWTEELRGHNKLMKRIGSKSKTLDEYIDYVHGIVPKRNPLKDWKPLEHTPSWHEEQSRRHREMYPSVDLMSSGNTCAKREPMKYTGTLIKGIATMHKSNAVPVIDEQHMKDIARMRRG
jgi:hypothetical protein